MSLFDHIIAGELAASFVYQDAQCVAFMDINPITRGHTLVVPRRSVTTLAELEPACRQHLWEVAHRIGMAQQQALGSVAQHLLINDGKGASQSVPHVHIHVIPRFGGDTLRTVRKLIWHVTTIMVPRRETPERRARLDALARDIARALDGVPANDAADQ